LLNSTDCESALARTRASSAERSPDLALSRVMQAIKGKISNQLLREFEH